MTGFDLSQGAPHHPRASSNAPPSAPYYFTPPARLPHVSTYHSFYEAQAIAATSSQPRYRPGNPINGVGSGVNALERVVLNGGWRLNTDWDYLSFCERFPPYNVESQSVQRVNGIVRSRPETPVPFYQPREAQEPLPSESSPDTPIPSVQPSPVQLRRRRATTQRYTDFYTYQGRLADAQAARQQSELRLNFNPWADTFRRISRGGRGAEAQGAPLVDDEQPDPEAADAPEPVMINASTILQVPEQVSTRSGGNLTPRQRPLEPAGSRSTPYQARSRAASYHAAQGEERPPRPDTPIPAFTLQNPRNTNVYMDSLGAYSSYAIAAAAAAGDEGAYVQRIDTGDHSRQDRRDREEGGGLNNEEDWFSLVLNLDADEDGNVVGSGLQDMQEGRRASQVPSASQSRRGSQLLGAARPALSRLMRMAVGQLGEEDEPAVPLPPIDPHRPRPPNVHFPSQAGSVGHNMASGPTRTTPHLTRPASPPVPQRGLLSRFVGSVLQRQSTIRSRASSSEHSLSDGASSGGSRTMRWLLRRSVRAPVVPTMPAPLAPGGQRDSGRGDRASQVQAPVYDQWLPTHDPSGRSGHGPRSNPAQSTRQAQAAALQQERHWYIIDLWFPNFQRTGNLPPLPPPGQLNDFWGVPFPRFRERLPAWNELNGREKAWVTGRAVDYVKTLPADLRAKWAREVLQEHWWMNVRRKAADDFCAICQEGYEPRDPVTFGPCKHVFHRDCERTWLKEKSTCPMCRRDFAALAAMTDLVPYEAVIEAVPAWLST